MNGSRVKNSILILICGAIIVIALGFRHPFSFIYTTPPREKEIPSVSVVVVGDIMLDRNVRNIINKKGFEYFFKGVEELISSADIAVGNLEGPFTPYPSRTASLQSKELVFTFDPELAPKLATLGFDALGLANNHSLNFGHEGLSMTRSYLNQAGILYYGDPQNGEELSTVISRNGVRIAFIGFHEFSYMNLENVYKEIEYLRPLVDIIIVNPHWGLEYKTEPTSHMVEWAHAFIDRGADAVIGAHPHIIASIEEYRGKRIYYSLGNFAFDQYFSEVTMKGLAIRLHISKYDHASTTISYVEIPIRVDREGVRVE